MFSQYVYVLNSDTGMSLSDRKLASKEIHSFRTLKALSMRTCCRSTDETHHRIPLEVS